ncbi:hypothetical protein A2U01_0082706, partial [Trifolium medium]|nr:hypothetical protein [Trifolium medium]
AMKCREASRRVRAASGSLGQPLGGVGQRWAASGSL